MFRKFLASSSELDPRTCNQLLVALRRAGMQDVFRNVFDELSQRGFPFDTWGYNICIHSFGCWRQLGLALKLFKEMRAKGFVLEPDLCTYNTVLGALCVGGKLGDALVVYEEMKGSGHEPDRFTYQNLILGCCKSYRVDEAIRIFREMEYNGMKADTLIYNTVLDGLFKPLPPPLQSTPASPANAGILLLSSARRHLPTPANLFLISRQILNSSKIAAASHSDKFFLLFVLLI